MFGQELVFSSQLKKVLISPNSHIPIIKSTHRSKNSFHKIENNNPWSPLHKMRVLSPRPKSPDTPSSRTTNLAASTTHDQPKSSR